MARYLLDFIAVRMSHIISPGPMAGAENVVLQGCSALRAQGHELSLIVMVESRCPQHAERFLAEARERRISVQTLDVRRRLDPSAVVRLRSTLRAHRPKVIHAHGYKGLLYAMLARPSRLPLVVTHHGETAHTRSVRLYEALARGLYHRADRVFSVSQATTESLVAAGVRRAKLRTVPNPVSLPGPRTADSEQRPMAQRLLFVGRLSEEKGLNVLLRALASPSTPPVLTLDVAGDGPCAEQWKALAAELGLEDRVRWLGVRRDVPDLLAGAQALVLPSLREGLPLVILEAASCEVPVLASRVGGVPEVVWEGETAVLVPPGDVAAWSKVLADWPRRCPALRDGARRRGAEIRARHAPERWAELTAGHYQELAG